jgi:aminoglycoside/choline kinase family phosphotransferase
MPQSAHHLALSELHRQCFGSEPSDILAIRGDGSDRLIFRLHGREGSTIGIFGVNVAENKAFIGFSGTFGAAGLPVPRIHAVSGDSQYYLEDDFGDLLLFDWQKTRRAGSDLPAEVFDMYSQVLRDLVRFQVDCAADVDYRLCYQYPEFGSDAMWFDVGYFRQMFLDQFAPDVYDAHRFDADCASLVTYLCTAERKCFLYRDFQSRNVLIHNGPRYIDYQSGRRGAFHYDAASLLYDARPRLPEPARERLFDAYLEDVRARIPLEVERERKYFHCFAVLRVMQALGAFGNLGARKGKTQFLHSIPPALANLATLASKPDVSKRLPYLCGLFDRLGSDEAVARAVALAVQRIASPDS